MGNQYIHVQLKIDNNVQLRVLMLIIHDYKKYLPLKLGESFVIYILVYINILLIVQVQF